MTYLYLALFSSGLAALINQVVWQRALRIYLAGAETASSMIVVITFMLGLGFGSLLGGRLATQSRKPLWILAGLEAGLAVVNVGIALALSGGHADSIYGMQRVALGIGVPLRAVYAFTAVVTLLVPCAAMGMTMPVAAETAQRQLGATATRSLGRLVLMNTLGSAAGGLLAGFYLLAYLGQFRSLFVASAANGLAAILTVFTARRIRGETAASSPVTFRSGALTREEILGAVLGLLSLSYEMYLFRDTALRFGPLPYHFAVVVVAFLLCWSIGFQLSQLISSNVRWSLLASGAAVTLAPLSYPFLAFLPCVIFGLAFGQVLKRASRAWGRDVGRFYALNTVGCAAGVVATFIGYEWPPWTMLITIAVGYLAALVLLEPVSTGFRRGSLAGATLLVLVSVIAANSATRDGVARTYYGHDGVARLDQDGNVYLDGLWHSRLSRLDDHVGTNNWLMAALPFLAVGRPVDRALVVGVGTGITAATLARSSAVGHVDGYEVNRTLAQVYRDFPDGTLHVATDPRISLLWQDGRSGLALRDVSYDLITSAPLYLAQAGSSILLSREYFSLVRQRLRPGGVFAVYANATGNEAQALAVRETLANTFPVVESFNRGYLLLASDAPIRFDVSHIGARDCADRLCAELRRVGAGALEAKLDMPRLSWSGPVEILDDHPIVEYPDVLEWLSARP